MVTAPKRTVRIARTLRKEMSLPEMLLWRILRQRPGGLKFRKQHPVGPYIIDFFCFEKRLAIEIDGIAHAMGDRPQRDEMRDAWLNVQRIQVVRIAAAEVLRDPEQVADAIVGIALGRAH